MINIYKTYHFRIWISYREGFSILHLPFCLLERLRHHVCSNLSCGHLSCHFILFYFIYRENYVHKNTDKESKWETKKKGIIVIRLTASSDAPRLHPKYTHQLHRKFDLWLLKKQQIHKKNKPEIGARPRTINK
jgi:hypothetical protein